MTDSQKDQIESQLPVTVTSITPQKKRKDRYSLFHNSDFVMGVSGQTLLNHNISRGTVLTPALFNKICTNEEYEAIKDACYRYLSLRDHAAFELKQKVCKKGLNPELTEEIITELSEKGLINDIRFAEKFASDKMEFKQWGPAKIRAALLQKGISRNTAQKVTEKLTDSLEQHGICVDLLRKRKAHFLRETDTVKRKQKMYRYLAGKGFHSKDIIATLEKLKTEFYV